MFLRVTRTTDGALLGDRVWIADTFLARFRGLMLHPPLHPGEGLFIEPCTSIHMMFMRFPIDAIFVDTESRVTALYRYLRPWVGVSGWHRNARGVIELPAGTTLAIDLQVGDQITVEPGREVSPPSDSH